MALFCSKAYVVASVDGVTEQGHYVTTLASADDEALAQALSTSPAFIAGLIVPGGRGVEIKEVKLIETTRVEDSGDGVVMAVRDAACVHVV